MSGPRVSLRCYVTIGPWLVAYDSTNMTFSAERAAVEYSPMLSLMTKKKPGILSSTATVEFYMQTDGQTSSRGASALLAGNISQPTQIQLDPGTPGSQALLLDSGFSKIDWKEERGNLRGGELVQDLVNKIPMLGKTMINTVLSGIPVTAATASVSITLPAIAAGFIGRFVLAVADPLGALGTSPTLDGRLESDSAGAFSGAEVTRGTLAQITPALTNRVQTFEIDGDVTPITATHWRWKFTTVGGTLPIFQVIASGAVMPKIH